MNPPDQTLLLKIKTKLENNPIYVIISLIAIALGVILPIFDSLKTDKESITINSTDNSNKDITYTDNSNTTIYNSHNPTTNRDKDADNTVEKNNLAAKPYKAIELSFQLRKAQGGVALVLVDNAPVSLLNSSTLTNPRILLPLSKSAYQTIDLITNSGDTCRTTFTSLNDSQPNRIVPNCF